MPNAAGRLAYTHDSRGLPSAGVPPKTPTVPAPGSGAGVRHENVTVRSPPHLPRDREPARDVDVDLEAGRSLRNGVLRPHAALGKTGSQIHLQPWQYRWVLRLRKILRGDLAEQTRTQRGSISERLRSGHNVQAVGFGCRKQESGREADASRKGDP